MADAGSPGGEETAFEHALSGGHFFECNKNGKRIKSMWDVMRLPKWFFIIVFGLFLICQGLLVVYMMKNESPVAKQFLFFLMVMTWVSFGFAAGNNDMFQRLALDVNRLVRFNGIVTIIAIAVWMGIIVGVTNEPNWPYLLVTSAIVAVMTYRYVIDGLLFKNEALKRQVAPSYDNSKAMQQIFMENCPNGKREYDLPPWVSKLSSKLSFRR